MNDVLVPLSILAWIFAVVLVYVGWFMFVGWLADMYRRAREKERAQEKEDQFWNRFSHDPKDDHKHSYQKMESAGCAAKYIMYCDDCWELLNESYGSCMHHSSNGGPEICGTRARIEKEGRKFWDPDPFDPEIVKKLRKKR